MPEIIEMIEQLIEQGHAYVSAGDVYFSTKSFPEYGKLSNQSLDDLQAGARIEVSEKKQNPLDFTLWKAAKPGEISWTAPWGEGRPGWHIECSAMSKKYLGETFDIHAGGHDLIFPHHENEIAQSEACNGKQFARYWMHNGYINIDDEKMSKSLGNFVTTHELLERYDSRALRFFLLSSHYRNPVNFSEDVIRQAVQGLERIDTALSNIEHWLQWSAEGNFVGVTGQTIERDALVRPFIEAMDDDFNTADALAEIFNLVRAANLYTKSDSASVEGVQLYRSVLLELLDILGLSPAADKDALAEEVNKLIHERDLARKNKDYQRADEIRDQLQSMDIILEDTPQGVRWKRK
jgi:cysteinyl-tRNA synthetase